MATKQWQLPIANALCQVVVGLTVKSGTSEFSHKGFIRVTVGAIVGCRSLLLILVVYNHWTGMVESQSNYNYNYGW